MSKTIKPEQLSDEIMKGLEEYRDLSTDAMKESVEKAADYIINTELNANAGNGGLIAVDREGNFAMPFNSKGMFRGFLYKEKGSNNVKKGCAIGQKMVTMGQ